MGKLTQRKRPNNKSAEGLESTKQSALIILAAMFRQWDEDCSRGKPHFATDNQLRKCLEYASRNGIELCIGGETIKPRTPVKYFFSFNGS